MLPVEFAARGITSDSDHQDNQNHQNRDGCDDVKWVAHFNCPTGGLAGGLATADARKTYSLAMSLSNARVDNRRFATPMMYVGVVT